MSYPINAFLREEGGLSLSKSQLLSILLLLTRQQAFFSSIPSLFFFFFFNLDFYFFQALLTFYLVCLQLIICTFFNLYNFSASLFSLYIFSFTPTHFFFPLYSFTFLPLFYLHTFFPHSLYISQPWTQQGAPGLESLDLSNLLLSQAENIDDRVLTVTCVVVFLCVGVCSS